MALLQNYDNHKNIYQPEVIASKVIGRQGNDYQINLRLRKKKITMVILDTDHDVHYFGVNPMRWACHSRATRISEVQPFDVMYKIDVGLQTPDRHKWRAHERGQAYWGGGNRVMPFSRSSIRPTARA